ncbi:TonB-dependent receptor domain-containing protein [Derxia lacustris]|uniref:TonB-dependent receptor domain-containing protein n=1 Tax=Derxia lacustris TaxID=764842 RepID=UPI000A16E8FB|nr:TonB-dependent receptor [Derxia lacustris]
MTSNRRNLLALAVALALLQMEGALAQAAPEAAAAETPAPAADNGLNLDKVVVTAAPGARSKLKQSVSVSTLDAEQIVKAAPTNAAEILRSVPGVRAESSGGEGNANITVRGVPISAGGARYVQFQEDGLPVLLFGDIAFGTADQFLRADYNLERLEVVRGGSASTLATNSPGGVINFLSKTGKDGGGNLGLTTGIGTRQTRYDFDYGGRLGDKTYFHVGGFYRNGEGGRPTGYTTEDGGQIKANITHELDRGYVRLSLKQLDDHTPTFLPVPVVTENGHIRSIAGVDPRTAFFIPASLARDTGVDSNGNAVTSNTRDGLGVRTTAIGAEAKLDLGDGWTLDEKFRKASNSGRFIGMYAADNGSNGTAGSFTGVLFNTALNDLGNVFNDLRLSKSIDDVAGGRLTLTGGLFKGRQTVAETWFWNSYRLSLDGRGATVLDAAGNPTSQPIGTGFTTFGGCCARNFNVVYDSTAPYAIAGWESGGFNVDASVRRDSQRANGWTQTGDATTGGWDASSQKTVNYGVDHTSYSVGSNYSIDRNLALFARTSDGVAFSADRLLYGSALDGSVPININEVKQHEGGVKWRNGGFSTFVTLFQARTKESNFEATTQLFTANRYKADGVELESAWRSGDFRVNGGLTYTHARIESAVDTTTVGNKPRRQADVVWQIAPGYAFGPFDLGASVVGTTKSFADDANTITLPAYAVVNGFVSYRFDNGVLIGLSANNLFDKLAYTEAESDGHAARALNGRTVKASLKYSF